MIFSLQMIRKLSNTSCLMSKRLGKRSNPGISHQIDAIEDAAKIIESDPEGFEGLESDLFNAHQSHKNYEVDLKRQKEKIREYIIKNKYFRKDPLPNLLTYAEKEHIKFLYSCDEEEWTVDKLAESFPANAEIISKILKAHWSPLSPKRIHVHDAIVLKNWERFKIGEYTATMSAELYEHLKKFVDRKLIDLKVPLGLTQKFLKKSWQKPISNEFSSIISSKQPKCINNREVKSLLEIKPKIKEIGGDNADSETYLLGKIKNKNPISIDQLKNQLSDQLKTENLENIRGRGVVSDANNSKTSNVSAHDYTEKFISNEVIISEFDRKRYGISETKQRIHIPRKLWRKGATYCANNSYYDDDGKFLYSVPGMNAKKTFC